MRSDQKYLSTLSMRGYIEMIKELEQKDIKCNLLYQALSNCCRELEQYTADIRESVPEFFINQIKKRGY